MKPVDEDHETEAGGRSVIEVDAESEPFSVLSIELSVGRRAAEILRQYLWLAISDPCILELKSRHDGASDSPIASLVGLKIAVRHRTNLAVPQGPRIGEFSSHLARAAWQIARISTHQHAPAAIDPKPRGQFIGQFQIHLFEGQIDSVDWSRTIENEFVPEM